MAWNFAPYIDIRNPWIPSPAVWSRELGPISKLPLHFAAIRTENFTPSLFDNAGIDRPAHIQRSVIKRQAEFLAGRICAREQMRALGNFHQVTAGKDGAPQWPPGILGSISHTSEVAVATAIRAEGTGQIIRGVGIDLERIVDSRVFEEIGAIVLNRYEHQMIRDASSLDHNMLSTIVFSAKESFFKATSALVGGYFGFDALVLVEFLHAEATLVFEVQEPLAPPFMPGFTCRVQFALGGDHVLTGFAY